MLVSEKFKDKIVVVKVGGELFEDSNATRQLLQDLSFAVKSNVKVVLVHGGGAQISRLMKRVGKEPKFSNGLRITDAESLEITAMVLRGQINLQIAALAHQIGFSAVGMSGVDAGLLVCRQRSIELGYVGDVVSVNHKLLETLLASGMTPIIAPLGVDADGQTFNLNADAAAGAISAALGATLHVVLTNVSGIYKNFPDESSVMRNVTSDELRIFSKSHAVSAGMIPKIDSVLQAVDAGVPCAHLVDGRVPKAVLRALSEESNFGTLVSN